MSPQKEFGFVSFFPALCVALLALVSMSSYALSTAGQGAEPSVAAWAVPGIVGAVIGAALRREDGVITMLLSVICGIACAAYVAPWVSDFFTMGESGLAFAGFGFGVTGMYVISGLMRVGSDLSKDPAGTLDKLRRGGKNGDTP